jgi:hypothetical protein
MTQNNYLCFPDVYNSPNRQWTYVPSRKISKYRVLWADPDKFSLIRLHDSGFTPLHFNTLNLTSKTMVDFGVTDVNCLAEYTNPKHLMLISYLLEKGLI